MRERACQHESTPSTHLAPACAQQNLGVDVVDGERPLKGYGELKYKGRGCASHDPASDRAEVVRLWLWQLRLQAQPIICSRVSPCSVAGRFELSRASSIAMLTRMRAAVAAAAVVLRTAVGTASGASLLTSAFRRAHSRPRAWICPQALLSPSLRSHLDHARRALQGDIGSGPDEVGLATLASKGVRCDNWLTTLL